MPFKLPKPGTLGLAAILLLLIAAVAAMTIPRLLVLKSEREVARLGGMMQVESSAPNWISRRAADLGCEALLAVFDTRVTTVVLRGADVDDRWIARLARHPDIERLDLSHTRITDAGLAPLRRLTRLRIVDLSATEIHGPGLAFLRACSNLQALDLYGCPVSGDALEHLAGATALEMLDLTGSQIGPGSLAPREVHRDAEFMPGKHASRKRRPD